MKINIEKELVYMLKRVIYSSVFLHFKKNIEKYNQWKPFFISLLIFVVYNIIVLMLCSLTFPILFSNLFVISCVVFFVYWYIKIEKLKIDGNTKNSKYWNEVDFWYRLDGWQFEQEVADVFRKNGYKAEVTKGSNDGGVDIIMYKDNLKFIVQCKRYINHCVTPQELRALWGVKDDFSADVVMMVTTSNITDSGRKFISNKRNFQILTLNEIIYLSKVSKTSNKNIKNKKKSYISKYLNIFSNLIKDNNLLLKISILLFLIFIFLSFLYCFQKLNITN